MNVKELFSDALPIISKFAPSIGGAISGPVGIAAGYIVPVLASAFGAPSTNISDIVSKILNDPDAQEKLQVIEHDHGSWLCGIMDSVNNLTKADIHITLEWNVAQK